MAPGGMAAPGMGMNMNMMGGAAMNLFRPNMPLQAPAPGVNPKKQRELYVGNVPTGQVSEPMLKELFSQILQQCGGFDPGGGAPVMNVQLRGGGTPGGGMGTTFAFVEFRDETCSQTIAGFNGMELYGRNLKISHPNGYVRATPATQAAPLANTPAAHAPPISLSLTVLRPCMHAYPLHRWSRRFL